MSKIQTIITKLFRQSKVVVFLGFFYLKKPQTTKTNVNYGQAATNNNNRIKLTYVNYKFQYLY